jgi:hypothetical protein
MNDLHSKLIYEARQSWLADDSYDDTNKFLIRVVVKECLSQMSDYLEKERVKKHFGMEE